MTSSKILFVCMGNICRSPAAEGVMQKLLKDRGLENQIELDSAGTISYHAGKPADPRMRQAAEARGYQLTSRSRPIGSADLQQFDWVIAMDRENLADIQGLAKKGSTAVIRLLSHYLSDQWPADTPDPYYGGDEGFEYVLDMIEAACPPLLEEVLQETSAK